MGQLLQTQDTTDFEVSRIPSVLFNLSLPSTVNITSNIVPAEGAVILVQAVSVIGRANILEDSTGHVEPITKGEVLPVALGKRRALRKRSGDVPTNLVIGDTIYLLSKSGVVGTSLGFYDENERPVELKVLGAVVLAGKQVNMKDSAVPRRQKLEYSAPIVGVIGTCMDVGKTTMICKLISELRKKDMRIAAVKLTGVASLRDLLKMDGAGADPVMGFMDGGLPSTCGDISEVVEVALGVLHKVNQAQPDLIVAEFGDGLLGDYGVEQLMRCPDIRQNTIAFILSAGDLVSVYGARELMKLYGAEISLSTGPAVNNLTAASYVEEHIGGLAESNQHAIPKTVAMVEANLEKHRTRLLGSSDTLSI
ncbi:hypothetical protein N7513_005226 [Penicillium frequentans]|nr:hypothetical protein N7513_005226 [Penicillium glabrum]